MWGCVPLREQERLGFGAFRCGVAKVSPMFSVERKKNFFFFFLFQVGSSKRGQATRRDDDVGGAAETEGLDEEGDLLEL